MSNIFLRASRLRLRFGSPNGQLSVEDIWDIPLSTTRSNKASLENIGAPLLARQRELAEGASIFAETTPSPEKTKVDLQVAILREVAQIRQAENKAKTQAAAKASEKARLEQLIREREGNELPLDELKKQLAELG
jgi:hypothetical protein